MCQPRWDIEHFPLDQISLRHFLSVITSDRSCFNKSWGLVEHAKPYVASVEVKQHDRRKKEVKNTASAQELCEQGGGPGLSFPIPILPHP